MGQYRRAARAAQLRDRRREQPHSGTTVDLKPFASTDRTQILDKAVDEILNGEIIAGTKATLLKQIQQPLPEVKAGNELNDDDDDDVPPTCATASRGGKAVRRDC